MWERLVALLRRLDLLSEENVKKEAQEIEGPDNPEIEFRSLNPPQAAALGADAALICPVTRQSLHRDGLLYLCRECNMAYSAEGWEFLRTTDKGRCCHCRCAGSVLPFHAGGKSQ